MRQDKSINLGYIESTAKEIGKALKSLEKWWIENDFTADREQLLERLAEPA